MMDLEEGTGSEDADDELLNNAQVKKMPESCIRYKSSLIRSFIADFYLFFIFLYSILFGDQLLRRSLTKILIRLL